MDGTLGQPGGLSVTQAVRRRAAARRYLARAVEPALLRELLELAARAPSGGNLQPWRVHVLTGAALRAFTGAMTLRLAEPGVEPAEYAVYPAGLAEPYRARRREAGAQRYAALGARDRDPATLRGMLEDNARFFGAPCGLFFCVPRHFGAPQWSDVGMYMQTLMLLATERGLATCPQEVWAQWPDTLRRLLDLPPDWMVFAGMALGYADVDHPINRIRTARAPLSEFAVFHGDAA
ncbi:nitroreductase [Bordetella genomosp. 13]|uniref:nitroreductase n=1 Tax=Bordetella genomosp. 13 TaxID=463040 RepID=UPI0011A0FF3C|nr:nitroreductase [Bordetella genomosp. 13]